MYTVRTKSGRVIRSFSTRAAAEWFVRGGVSRHSSGRRARSPAKKDPKIMSASEINKELDRLSEKSSAIGQQMIDAGRGHETFNDTYKIGRGHDPLTDAYLDVSDRRMDLQREIHLRYGPGAPSRLPAGRGFGPRKTSYSPTGWRPGDLAVTNTRIPADPYPIGAPVGVVVEEVVGGRNTRRKDRFGHWETTPGRTRIRVSFNGKSYWVDADTLDRP